MPPTDDLLLALDPVAFARALGFEPDRWQAEVLRAADQRLLLNCCRQSGKSTTAAILALHVATYRPGALVLLVSKSERQSKELLKMVRKWRRRIVDGRRPELTEDNAHTLALANGSRIVSLPSSEATIRGFPAPDLVIEDEAARVPDEVHTACRPMLAVSNGRHILMSTPYGQRGHFHALWTEGADGWRRWEIPASACPRISAEFLAQERLEMSPWEYQQEYECVFAATEDQLFDLELIRAAYTTEFQPFFGPASPEREPGPDYSPDWAEKDDTWELRLSDWT